MEHDDPDGVHDLLSELRSDVRNLGVDEHTTEDVVQETMLRGVRHRPAVDNLRAWLHVVATRIVSHRRRSERHRRQREERVARPLPVEWSFGEREDSHIVRYVRELPSPYREVVELRYLEDRELPEISAMLGRPEATVRSQLKRGLDRIRARLVERNERSARSFVSSLLARAIAVGRDAASRRGRAVALAGASLLLLLAPLAGWLSSNERAGAETTVARSLPSRSSAPDRVELRPAPPARTPAAPALASLSPEDESGRLLSGLVLDPDGRPVAGATVNVGASSVGQARPVARTDADGRYTARLDDTARVVWATGSGWHTSRRRALVTVPEGVDCDLALGRASTVRLRVLTADDAPVAGATLDVAGTGVSAYLSPAGFLEYSPGPVAARTDGSGYAELALADGAYTLRIRAEGRAPFELALGAPRAEERKIVLPRSARVVGRVVDARGAPVWNAHVEAAQLDESARVEVRTDVDGSFAFDALGSGALVLRAWEEVGWTSGLHEATLQEGAVERVLLTLDAAHTLTGFIDGDAGGASVRAKRVDRDRDRRPPRNALILPDGSFVLVGCPTGQQYRLELMFPHSPVLSVAVVSEAGGRACRLAPKDGTWDRCDLTIEVEWADGIPAPMFVELRQTPGSLLAPVDPLTSRAVFRDRASFPCHLFVWVPGIGAWKADELVGGPGDPGVVRVRVPAPGRVRFFVEEGGGADGAVHGSVSAPGFDAFGFEPGGLPGLSVELARGADGSYAAMLFPKDEYRYTFRSASGADVQGVVHVAEGVTTTQSVVFVEGVEVELAAELPRSLAKGEKLDYAVRTARGVVQLVSLQPDGRPFRARLPRDSVEVVVTSDEGLRGAVEVTLPPAAADSVSRYVVELAD